MRYSETRHCWHTAHSRAALATAGGRRRPVRVISVIDIVSHVAVAGAGDGAAGPWADRTPRRKWQKLQLAA